MVQSRLISMTMLVVATVGAPLATSALSAQAPTDSTVTDSTAVKKGRFGGLMNKAKSVAHNKAVQGAAKGVACTVVPGGAVSAATGKGPCANSGLVGGVMAATGKGASVLSAASAMGAVTGLSNSAAQAAAMKIMKTSGMNGLSNSAAQSAAMKVMIGNGMTNVMAQKAMADMMKNSAASAAPSPADAAAALQMLQNMGMAPPGKAAAVPVVTVTPALAVPAPNAWVAYDFVPGDKVIYYSDFSDAQVGNFPDRLTFVEGNMDVIDQGGRHLMRVTSASTLQIPLAEILPQRFTIEIDFINRPSLDGAAFHLRGNSGRVDDSKTSIIGWGSDGVALLGGGGGEVKLAGTEAMRSRYRGKPAQLRILGDGKYIKVYLDEKKLANVPNANFERSNLLHMFVGITSEQNPAYISRIRVSESRKSLYDDLAAGGRVATQGLMFDDGSDQLRPESAPTLRQIATMLQQHSDLRLRIEGHTDNAGVKAANQKLSEKRAAAIKTILVSQYKVNGGRLDAKGFGDTKPSADNSTVEGRANNRRVELAKM